MQGFITALKFVVGILLIPVLYLLTMSIHAEFLPLPSMYEPFLWGVVGYLIMFLFVYKLEGFYQFGQRLFSDILRFSSAAASVVTVIVPLYATLILIVFYLCTQVLSFDGFDKLFVFFSGFTLAMHVILTAQDAYADDSGTVKPHYFFMTIIMYIFNLLIVAALFDLTLVKFSFPDIMNRLFESVGDFYGRAF